ncbi:hypothetical protein F5I97DRAFT_1946996 [Phlebopus sp. FC_14]|nr:hypothetical protein F5I97DRAFT_1946996 [Phlebopus sp. FC_14]
MGRPLFSKAFQTAPAVREPQSPQYEKWSYLNAFDPDSDEFFESEQAVYEAFMDPVTSGNSEDEEEGDEDRDVLVVRLGYPASSERDSPMAAGADEPAHLVVDDFHDLRRMEDSEAALTDPTVRVRLATRPPPGEIRWANLPSEGDHDERLATPAPSAPIPVPIVRSRRADEGSALSPSTPPSRQTPAQFSPSPPPTSTPRIYSWAHNPSYSNSPSAGSPFTNPHARTSYAHLSPALIRIRDVVI